MATYTTIEMDGALTRRVALSDPAGNVVTFTGGVLPIASASGVLPIASPIGAATMASSFPGLNATATTVFIARPTRVKATVVNYGGAIAYLGVSTVTSSTGNRIDPGASRVYSYTGLLQGITASGATTNLDVQDEF